MSVVIVGAGHGGVQTAASLREGGYDGSVVVLDRDSDWPYQRPPLSKEYLATSDDDPQPMRGPGFYADRHIELRLGELVESIDTGSRRLTLRGGEHLDYEHLVLALGSCPRPLPLPGADLDGVMSLQTRADAHRLRHALAGAQDVVIIGGGFIGLEIAAAARAAACRVTVIEPQDRVLARAVVPVVSRVVESAHSRLGTDVRLGAQVVSLRGDDGRVSAAILGDGSDIKADLVLVAVGVTANIGVAVNAGLEIDNGVLVDRWQRTSAPGVYAIGDCASRREDGLAVAQRLECVQNAVEQGRFVAGVICSGQDGSYDAIPWFWTMQPGLRIQTVGVGRPDDVCVVLGDPTTEKFSVCRFGNGRLVAVESVNRPGDHMAARRILGAPGKPTVEEVSSADFSLKECAGQLV